MHPALSVAIKAATEAGKIFSKMIAKIDLKFPMECVVALNQHRIIGDGNKLLWHLPGDLKRLKSKILA